MSKPGENIGHGWIPTDERSNPMTNKELEKAFKYDKKKVDAGIKKGLDAEKGRMFGDENDKLPTDKLMDEVMGDIIKYCRKKDEDRDCARYFDSGECAECSFALIPKACRMYAWKVVYDAMIKSNCNPMVEEILQPVIDRLTDKEPA